MKVITVHGIRRSRRWNEDFEEIEEIKRHRIEILNFDYGYFSLWDFLRKSKREDIIQRFCTFYSENMIEGGTPPSAIGHSFGTYVLYWAMRKYDSIKFDRIIFCGSILNSKLDLRPLLEKKQFSSLMNDYGEKEWFIAATRYIIDKSCGKAGKVGFLDIPPNQKKNIMNRKNYQGHSDYFLPIHMKKNWLSYLTKNNDKFGFNEDILRQEVIDRIYKNIDKNIANYEINEVRFNARIDNSGNYYAKYERFGINNNIETVLDSISFVTSADGFHPADSMNFIAYDSANNRLSYTISEDIIYCKTFRIHLHTPAPYKASINTKNYFSWTNTINLKSGDTDHFVVKNIRNVAVFLNFPNELKLPKFFRVKNRDIVGVISAERKIELDGSFTYFLDKYENQENDDGLVFYFEGISNINRPLRKSKLIEFSLKAGRRKEEYMLTEVSPSDISKVYKLELGIELQNAANESILIDRRNMFNEGFLVIKKKKNQQVIGYLESVIWNEKPFQTFAEISNFPMHYHVNGECLYIIFIAVDKVYRRQGMATKLIKEIETVARKYNVKKMRLVAKDRLVTFYSKFGFHDLQEMPAFLKDKPYKSILMEKILL